LNFEKVILADLFCAGKTCVPLARSVQNRMMQTACRGGALCEDWRMDRAASSFVFMVMEDKSGIARSFSADRCFS